MTLVPPAPVLLRSTRPPAASRVAWHTGAAALAGCAGAALPLAADAGPAQVVLFALGLLVGGGSVAALRRSGAEGDQSRQEQLQALSRQVLHDPLTGLPNRVMVEDRLRAALARAQRSGSRAGLLSTGPTSGSQRRPESTTGSSAICARVRCRWRQVAPGRSRSRVRLNL